ncbi:glycoside hydrolase family 43 protein [Subtercola sp. RTI3]|uniref:glycoside hydrolase family 43 protein n=1 Tax=Subtercola sp. RTI3 TaxID=3048639 RepID=UPI002B231F67|nr:family 43 glycosylhydrolase [Subtercola sp. RTI3]MEA9984263.1 family 43 glycosylhydrolase [Subtercola sp. RTI3]
MTACTSASSVLLSETLTTGRLSGRLFGSALEDISTTLYIRSIYEKSTERVSVNPAQTSRPAQPVLPGFYPDPSVCRVGEMYYLVTSTFEYQPGLPIHASRDLVSWQAVGSVVTDDFIDLSGAPDSGGLYAPTIRYHKGLFYLACTVVGSETGSGSFYTTAVQPTGPWSPPVFLSDAQGIDPTLFFDGDDAWWAGCRLVVDGEYDGQTEIWLRRLDLAAERLIGEEFILWKGAVKGAVWSEGPHLYKRGEWYYLLTAEGGTERNHAVSVARAHDVTGPYTGSPRNPVFTHRTLGEDYPVQCVGHADLVESEHGDWFAVMLGTRPEEGYTVLGRETFAVPVVWEEDWPVFNPGVGRLSDTLREWNTGARSDLTASYRIDLAAERTLDNEWLAPRSSAVIGAHSASGLELVNTPGLSGQATSGFLGRRLQHHSAEISVTFVYHRDSVSDIEFGLLWRQSSTFNLRLSTQLREGGIMLSAVTCRDGVLSTDAHLLLSPAETAPGEIRITGAITGTRLEFSAEFGGEQLTVGSVDATVLSTETAGGFVGTVVGPYLSARRSASVVLTSFSYEGVPS